MFSIFRIGGRVFGALVLLFVFSSCGDDDDQAGPNLPTWDDDPCAAVPELRQYDTEMGRWRAQTDAAPYETGRTVFTGSSSIRFWEQLQEDLADWAPIQRGFGGSVLWELVNYIDETVLRHEPNAVVIFSGTNDIFINLEPQVVADTYRCVVEKIALALGDDVSIHYISITPTPSRWPIWANGDEANSLIKEIAADWRGLHFIDTTPDFLATGEPPDASLFISDGLHLSDAGYALWGELIGGHLDATVPRVRSETVRLASGTRVLVDLGPSNPEDGAPTDSPDAFGRYWNNWSPVDTGVILSSGEHIGELVDTTGAVTGLRLVLSGASHFTNGIRDGGLVDPDPELLGDLAVSTATQDYFFTAVTGTVVSSRGSLTLEGLDPDARYRLRLFASREASERGSTRYTVSGGGDPASAELVTSGEAVGADGAYDGNDSNVVELIDLRPDPTGRLHLNFEPVVGSVAYLSLLELVVE